MARTGVAVDIGHGSIKIIQITKKGDYNVITDCAKIPVPPGTIRDDGLIVQPPVLIDALKSACSQTRFRKKKIIIAVANNLVVIKHLKLPVILGPELSEVIRSEAEKFLSFPITEAVYDWDILRQDNGEMELMVVATQKENINSQLSCLENAGLRATVVDLQSFALLRSLKNDMLDTYDNTAGVAVLDIGSAATQMAIFFEGSIRETRIINIAGHMITQAITDQLQISYEKAETIKCNWGDADYVLKELQPDSETENFRANQIITQKLAELVVEIGRSVEYFKLQFPGTPLTEFILTGGSSKLRNLAPFLERELGVTVRLGDPLNNLQLDCKQTDRAVILGNPYQFSVAIGLALRGVE